MSIEHTHARQLAIKIRLRIEAGELPIHGYDVAAELINLDGERYARHMGQVASRIDAASFVAGLPMLAMHMVRKSDGTVNPASFEGWESFTDEISTHIATHVWTVDEVDQVIKFLDSLPDQGALAIWESYTRREVTQPGFLRYNLHRRVANTQR